MARRRREPPSAEELLEKIRDAGLSKTNVVKNQEDDFDKALGSLESRIEKMLSITKSSERNPQNMLFFVMYDIESNKVRRMVAKYLLRQGCFRIQRSIFLADMPHEKCEKIKSDLSDVQAAYDNEDSILVVPISTDYLRAMKIIGCSIDIDVIMRTRNTLFF